jgi:Lon-like ATP-dependent protease
VFGDFFPPPTDDELVVIAKAALTKVQMSIEDRALMQIIGYVQNGRDCVNSLAMAASLASTQGKQCVTLQEIQFVIASSQREKKILPFLRNDIARIGCVYALMVLGPSQGMVVDVETVAMRAQDPFRPKVITGGIIDEIEQKNNRQALRTKSEIKTSIDTVLTALQPFIDRKTCDYDLHIHLNGSFPVEGGSAGLAIALTIYSAIMQKPISPNLAVLGTVSLHGVIGPVAEVSTKIRTAKQSGISHLIVPEGNRFDVMGFDETLTIEYVMNLEQAINLMVEEPKVRQRKVISIQCTEK